MKRQYIYAEIRAAENTLLAALNGLTRKKELTANEAAKVKTL